jgi:RNA polymerase sigma-70 factor, ECF subfamily
VEEPQDRLKSSLAAGDTAAYRQAYDRYGPALFAAALRMLGNRADAEDAVQEVFAALVRSRSRIAHVADLTAYVFATRRHAAVQLARRRQRQPAANLMDVQAPSRDQYEDPNQADRLWRLVGRLPEAQREVLALKIQGDLTFAQIGVIFGISPNTAASRYRYALEKLQQMLEK